MGRGLDGFFFPGLVRFSRLAERSLPFSGGVTARGKHLFPFRTEPLSLSAPMVLGGKPPGRVGRRRFFASRPPYGAAFLFSFGRTARGYDPAVIWALIFGIIAGYLGRALMPGKQDIGFFATMIVGVIGSLVGYFIFTELLGIGDTEAFDFGGLPGAVIGVILVLWAYSKLVGGRTAAASGGSQTICAGLGDSRRRQSGWASSVTGSSPYSPSVAKSMTRSAASRSRSRNAVRVESMRGKLRAAQDGNALFAGKVASDLEADIVRRPTTRSRTGCPSR